MGDDIVRRAEEWLRPGVWREIEDRALVADLLEELREAQTRAEQVERERDEALEALKKEREEWVDLLFRLHGAIDMEEVGRIVAKALLGPPEEETR